MWIKITFDGAEETLKEVEIEILKVFEGYGKKWKIYLAWSKVKNIFEQKIKTKSKLKWKYSILIYFSKKWEKTKFYRFNLHLIYKILKIFKIR